MALLTACNDTNKVITRKQSWSETFSYLVGSSGIAGIADLKAAKSIHTPETIEYVGLDYSTASGYVASNPATVSKTGTTTTKVESVEAVQVEGPMYKVVIQQETITDPVEIVAS